MLGVTTHVLSGEVHASGLHEQLRKRGSPPAPGRRHSDSAFAPRGEQGVYAAEGRDAEGHRGCEAALCTHGTHRFLSETAHE